MSNDQFRKAQEQMAKVVERVLQDQFRKAQEQMAKVVEGVQEQFREAQEQTAKALGAPSEQFRKAQEQMAKVVEGVQEQFREAQEQMAKSLEMREKLSGEAAKATVRAAVQVPFTVEPTYGPICLTGYDATGARVATAQDQRDHWSFSPQPNAMMSSPEDLEREPDLHAVLERMQEAGATLMLAVPLSQSKAFIDQFSDALAAKGKPRD